VDALVDATHTGILKPDPRAYRLALEALDISAERILFVDDQLRNVEGRTPHGDHHGALRRRCRRRLFRGGARLLGVETR